MLACAFSQKQTIQAFHRTLVDRCEADMFPNGAWDNIGYFLEYLDVFKTATTKLSGVYYPTSCWVLQELYNISLNCKDFENKNDLFEHIVDPMKKFLKYFEGIPPVFTCAAALNPYINVAGVEALIKEIYDNMGAREIDPMASTEAKDSFNKSLQEIYDHYFKIYGSSSKSTFVRQATPSKPCKDKLINMMNAVRESAAKRQRSNTPTSELGRHSGANYVEGATVEDVRNLDILAWWKGKQNEFPILSAMSRDLLSVQASTVASESVFSLSGRILSMRRTKLTPESLEMCICLKDHLDVVDRIQDKANFEDEIPLKHPIQEMEEESSGEEDKVVELD
ncbi:zinc finger BED domain-containing protein RICESLEEPER 3-like [Bidens hawaiensis]|uniref:zinc finger BED domain-containing protein RICESLEEPER 3-like n=1 Tax=Bidens hawaiensis TaxID=980011 RepID=UPI00404A7891